MNTPVVIADAPDETPERLPILPLQELVLFPHVVLPLAVTTPEHISLVDDVLQSHKLLALGTLKPDREPNEDDVEDPPF